MNVRPKRVPRLWCALQGLLPLEQCLAAQRAELAWPAERTPEEETTRRPERNRIAEVPRSLNVRRRGSP
jgi:hypothetical protein